MSPRWSRVMPLLAPWLVVRHVALAAYVGVAACLFVPAHVFVGMTHDRGIMDSLWEMHGEELSYALPYQTTDPEAAAVIQRVWAERLDYLGAWLLVTLAGLILAGLALTLWLWWNRWVPGHDSSTG